MLNRVHIIVAQYLTFCFGLSKFLIIILVNVCMQLRSFVFYFFVILSIVGYNSLYFACNIYCLMSMYIII